MDGWNVGCVSGEVDAKKGGTTHGHWRGSDPPPTHSLSPTKTDGLVLDKIDKNPEKF